MDYEKKYKDALARARSMYESKDDAELAAFIFPELTESEDERIKKELVAFFKGMQDSDWHEKYWHDLEIDRILAYLEKQKENPKSADSIPSDCTSDAKCEDRWHKVSDSLPDNPREVLCKDEAGNYFIGRYYTGEGWDISNYDDEDKPHHLNPPVSKWIDFPSEKQKEQKKKNVLIWGEPQVTITVQKPAKWSDEDEDNLHRVIRVLEDNDSDWKELSDWLKSLRPSWKPSEMNTNCEGCLYWTGKCKLPKGLQCPERKEEKK